MKKIAEFAEKIRGIVIAISRLRYGKEVEKSEKAKVAASPLSKRKRGMGEFKGQWGARGSLRKKFRKGR